MKRDRRRWKNYLVIRIARVTARRLRKLVPGATSYAEAAHEAVDALDYTMRKQENRPYPLKDDFVSAEDERNRLADE